MPHHVLDDGTSLYYEDVGEGRPILFVHGLMMSHALWMYQTLELRKSYRVIVPDLRGHGRSDRPNGSYSPQQHAADLAELLEALDVREVCAVGWSMGVPVVTDLYWRCPDRIHSLGLVNGAMTLMAHSDYPFGRTTEDHERNIARIQADHPQIVRDFVRSIFKRDVGAATLDLVERIALDIPAWISYDEWDSLARVDLRDALPGIGVPILVVHGQEDPRIDQRSAEWTAAHAKHARLELMAGCGHTPFIEDKDRFNEILRDWLDH